MGLLKTAFRTGMIISAGLMMPPSSRVEDDSLSAAFPDKPLERIEAGPTLGPLPDIDYNFEPSSQDSSSRFVSVRKDGVEHFLHAPYGTQDPDYSVTSKTNGIQFEAGNFYPFSIMLDGSIRFNTRHCVADADIQENTAQITSGIDIDVRCLNVLLDTKSLTPLKQNLLQSTDVATMSYMLTLEKDSDGFPFRAGSSDLQNAEKKNDSFEFWDNQDVITVHAAGNYYAIKAKQFLRQGEYIFDANDTHMRVGAAVLDAGTVYVDYYSAPTAPAVVAYSPFENGFKFHYYYDFKTVEAFVEAYFTSPYDFVTLSYCTPRVEDFRDGNMPKIKKDFKGCLKTLYNQTYKKHTPVVGTSHTAPHVSGMILGAKARIENIYGENFLSAHDYYAATMLSAASIEKLRTPDTKKKVTLRYVKNGAGLHFNENYAGYGLITDRSYNDTVSFMAQEKAAAPSLETRPVTLSYKATMQDIHTFEKKGKFKEYQFEIEKSSTLLRAHMEFSFSGGAKNVPQTVQLIAPSGAVITVSPSAEQPDDTSSFADTVGFLGNNTQGTWRIRIPHDTTLYNFEARMIAVETGGLIDKALAHKITGTKGKIEKAKKWSHPPLRFD